MVINVISNGSTSSESLGKNFAFILFFKIDRKVLLGSIIEKFISGFKPFKIGIGINKGKAVSGNIGSDQQMNYTVIGDTINLGARLCSHAKSGQILISNSVKGVIGDNYDFKKIPTIKVKGKSKPIEVWSYMH